MFHDCVRGTQVLLLYHRHRLVAGSPHVGLAVKWRVSDVIVADISVTSVNTVISVGTILKLRF